MNQTNLNNQVAVEFYIPSQKPILINYEEQEQGYVQCKIYSSLRYNTFLRGCAGNIMIIKISPGCIIKTNDLWIINESWTKTLPVNTVMGEIEQDWKEVERYKKMTDTDAISYGIELYIY